MSDEEIFDDRPTQRYSTGILYPPGSRIKPDEDEDGGASASYDDDMPSTPDDSGVALHATLKPSAAGLSFAVAPSSKSAEPRIRAAIQCAEYKRFAVDEEGNEIEGVPATRSRERWRRFPLRAEIDIPLLDVDQIIDLAPFGISGLNLYVISARQGGLITVTVAMYNTRQRGDSSAYDEEQHFFQSTLRIACTSDGDLAPRPSMRMQNDDDSKTAGLIYRDVQEFAVGHTCSARTIEEGTTAVAVETDWIPSVVVPAISDKGYPGFEKLRTNSDRKPLEASWLADAPPNAINEALSEFVSCYDTWIADEASRIDSLPFQFQTQAKLNLDRCMNGSERMLGAIRLISADSQVRTAFQLAQRAMNMQFVWRRNTPLVWRPFQLAFQLLVLESLAVSDHVDRETMDLLWFPTGGGKTEAYLALTAFIILLRRLRQDSDQAGSGIVVLMRYTLRLLTIQQFQRAAAIICACELLRRESRDADSAISNLGAEPVGIGLWVGAAATPATLADALNRKPGDPSTHEQLTKCPCCGERLEWKLSPKESTVVCNSEDEICELADGGTPLPVWTIDDVIYRMRPSLLIGTVDKFAQIVRKPETTVLFGRRTTSLPPELIIQDELHLISGPLGSVAGLYEVAIDELCRSKGLRAKIIGSTATIRRAEDQIRSLFDRKTYQFPAPGIDANNSGFAVVDQSLPGRVHVGLTTSGRSATYMLQALVASLLQAASDPVASEEERNYYWTLVAYFNSLRELGRALVLMQDDVPVSIRQFAARREEQERKVAAPDELTSRVRSFEIRDMIDRLEIPASNPESVDLLVASNMISVGVDIQRLGLMVVNAQPKTLAEYIQATSRVGRGAVPGIVVTTYNSMRARDRSRFETFETWHRCLYRDVEATSVTPFAARAQDKALHAVLVALVRHQIQEMTTSPVLTDVRLPAVEQLCSIIEARVRSVDPAETAVVSSKLQRLIDTWVSRPDLQVYWDDYNRRISLLMSAEQFAAKADVNPEQDQEGARRALWSTPNSMREVEAGTPFVLRSTLRAGDG
ncbi:MAG: helicase-related protein [Actinomycetota bacterium]